MTTNAIFGPIRQLGFMSRDIDKSIAYFVEKWGIGPWFILRNVKNTMVYRGTPVELEMSIAMSNCGDLQFEIVAQHNQTQSLYTDALNETPELHVQHVAVWTKDVAAMEKDAHSKGWESIFETGSGPGRSVFIAHPDAPKVCIELSDCNDFKDNVRQRIKEIAGQWDGENPVREEMPQ